MGRWTWQATIGIAAVAATAACGASSGGGAKAAPANVVAPVNAAATPTVALKTTSLGEVLVDGQGRTLYLWEGDKGTTSACTGACETAWPPLESSGTPTAGTGVTASKLAVAVQPDGGRYVTYAGHLLYRFTGDTAPGQVTGEDVKAFGAGWYVLAASGIQVEPKATSGSSSSGSSGGYHY